MVDGRAVICPRHEFLRVLVLPANLQDRETARQLLAQPSGQSPRRFKHIWADDNYTGGLVARARQRWRCMMEIVKRTDTHVFEVLPRRWVVERIFG